MTAKAAVVGWPIQHSLSPVLHGHWLREYGIDGTYEKIAIEPGIFAERIAELREAGYRGVNVTVPFKEEAFALATQKQSAAIVCGAANLLTFGTDIGCANTDAFGLSDSIEEALGEDWICGKHVVMLGAGGAARGVAYGLHYYGAARVTILNRAKGRAEQLMAYLKGHLPDANFHTGTLDDWNSAAIDADLLVNTTSAGMKGNPPLALELAALPNAAAVCDIVYNPLMTPLLSDARARNMRTVDGLGMLMHQAAPSFEAFFGVKPQVTPALRAVLVEALQARG